MLLQLDADNYENDTQLAQIKKERGYSYQDCVTCTPEKLPNYEEKANIMMQRFVCKINQY